MGQRRQRGFPERYSEGRRIRRASDQHDTKSSGTNRKLGMAITAAAHRPVQIQQLLQSKQYHVSFTGLFFPTFHTYTNKNFFSFFLKINLGKKTVPDRQLPFSR